MSRWWERFFEGAALTLWRELATEQDARDEAVFVIERLGLSAGDRVLDVPCGNGRHLRALAAHEIVGTGVDASAEFIAEAGERSRGIPLELHRREMRDLPWRDRFDAAICLGNSFGYLDDAGNREFLTALSRTLRPRGRLLLQTATLAECCLTQGLQPTTHRIGSLEVETVPAYDSAASVLRVAYTFRSDKGAAEVRTAEYQVYTLDRLRDLLHECGFERVEAEGDRSGRTLARGDEEAWIVARAVDH